MPPRGKVLVVDDDPTTLEIVQAVLEDMGYEVTTRNRALGTTAAILRLNPDVVLIDVEMPGLSGSEIVRLGRESPVLEDTLFILHSGARSQDLDRLCVETGAGGAIAKTGDQRSFTRQFEALVQRHSRRGD